jgi:hypothetical protein
VFRDDFQLFGANITMAKFLQTLESNGGSMVGLIDECQGFWSGVQDKNVILPFSIANIYSKVRPPQRTGAFPQNNWTLASVLREGTFFFFLPGDLFHC